MPILEFQLRVNGYNRLHKEKWYHTRFITYYNLKAAGALKNESIEKFMPLDDVKKEIDKSYISEVAQMQRDILKIK